MSNRILNLVFKADTSQAKTALKELEGTEGRPGGVSGISLALTKAQLLWAAYGTAATLAVNQAKKEVDKYVDYIDEVDDLAASLGLSMQEASFLKGAMDEYEISSGTMLGVFRRLATEGIDPTVESLGNVLAEWDKMPAGSEKTKEAMRLFGEQGIGELIPWWDSLDDAEKRAFGSLGTYMEVSDDMVANKDDYIGVVNEFTNAWNTFKLKLIDEVIPALTIALQLASGGGVFSEGEQIKKPGQGGVGFFESFSPGYLSSLEAKRQKGLKYSSDTPHKGNIGHAAGGSFIVGGRGGPDTTPVSFMATPGETVTVGGGTNDMAQMLAEVRRLVDTLPTTIADAVERR